ncbi:MAG: BMP family ABC transporter substrate-binding protein [Acidimicrobiia bacterium]|nr:BMP family ABC transporter substrate-binding protein [Acidimicrobiia bacterium]
MNQRTRMALATLSVGLLAAACGGGSGSPGRLAARTDDAPKSADGGGSTDQAAADVLDVAFVYIGPVGDAGWTKRHDDGAKSLEAALGDKVRVTRIENVPEGEESTAVFEKLASDGTDLIFGTSFGYMDPMLEVAADHPEVCFQHVSGYKSADNMGNYFGAAEEARYLSGIVAARTSATGRLGYVAAFPIPEVIRGINAFTLGARSVNPAATVEVAWTSTWFDPAVERAAADGLLQGGVDVITQHQDTPATGEAALAHGAKWIGYNDDMNRFVPEAFLTSPMWDWGPHTIRTAEAVMEGTCPVEPYYGDMADGTVTLAPFGVSVDGATKAAVETARAKIVGGTLLPFAGPIVDQAGVERYPAGAAPSLGDLLGMDYFVAGVVGTIPAEG